MYKITIKGKASTSFSNPRELDGIDCQDNFSEYFNTQWDQTPNEQALIDKKVTGGYMFFVYEDNCLMTYTKYDCPEKLTEEELKILGEYTQGQWSDGVGEGFEQYDCYTSEDGEEAFISPYHYGQTIEITQELK